MSDTTNKLDKPFFEPTHYDTTSKARTGVLHLAHGDVETPVYMPVGTAGTVKGVYHKTLREIGYNLILGNTYHLYLRPGREVLDTFEGGLHGLSNWPCNILTDSGGYQAFSLTGLRKYTDDGVAFQSHIDGSKHFFSPESVLQMQGIIGSDIAMCLDVCLPPGVDHNKALEGMIATHRWAEKTFKERERLNKEGAKLPHSVFGIAQGNFYDDLRDQSARYIASLPFEGIAIGGLSVGETPNEYKHYLEIAASAAHSAAPQKPRYIMGIGNPEYIFDAVENGVDMFDCVLGTRIARNGAVFTSEGILNLRKPTSRLDHGPIEEGCQCEACQHYSRAYMHHLFKAGEMFGAMLASEHNLTFLYNMVKNIRQAILENRFKQFREEFFSRYQLKSTLTLHHI